jgi:serine protease Do
MKRRVAMALGIAGVLAAGLVLGPAVRAAGGEKQIEKRVVVRHAGGGFLGVGLDDVEGDARGAKVRSVRADSPAAKAGIKEEDVIVRFDGEGVRSVAQLMRLVGETPAGRTVPVEVLRAGKAEKLTVTLGEGEGPLWQSKRDHLFRLPLPPARPDVRIEDGAIVVSRHEPPRLGVEYIEISGQLAEAFQLESDEGVLVASVQAGSPAAQAGVKAADVILELDGHEIEDAGDLRRVVDDVDGGETVTIKVLRAGRPLELEVTFREDEKRSHGPAL